VDALIQAGANLGGFDVEGGFAKLAMENALRSGDRTLLSIWYKTGIQGSFKNDT
jgi:60kDa lysophospholipase